MAWSGFLGSAIFFVAVVAAVVLYALKRKFYPVMFLVSVALYIYTVGFVIDVFDVSKNGILLILAISSVVMMGLGRYLSKGQSDAH